MSSMSSETKINRYLIALFGLAFAILATLHVAFYLKGEHHLYVNDFRNYWIAYWKSSIQFKQNIGDWARMLRGEIWGSDYNSLPAALLLPFSLVFGYERFGYIWGATITYLVPVALLSAKAASLVVREEKRPTLVFLIAAVVAACYVPFWAPTLLGWIDIAGLIPLILAFITVKTAGFGKRIRPGMAILLGLLIWMPFLIRRWYAFAIVAFVLSAPIYCMVLARLENRTPWNQAFVKTVINFAMAGVTSLTFCLIAQGGLVQSILNTSYASIYVAYQRPPLEHFLDLWNNFGGLYLGLALIGQMFLFRTASQRTDALFINANIVLLFALFTRTQGFGAQHYLPLAFWIYLLICIGLRQILPLSPRAVPWVATGVVLVAALALITSFYRSNVGVRLAGTVFPQTTYNNQIGDEQAYARLTDHLNALLKPGETFTAFASHKILNRDLLLSASRESLAGKDVDTSHVDLIQGLSVAPFMARYAVVTDPVLTHLPEGTQTVITIPAKAILTGQGIGAAYERVGQSYAITDSVKAFIYVKTRAFTLAEVDALLADFYRRYPDWREVYGTTMFKLAMTASAETGDQWGKFEYARDGSITVHPGETTPTRATFSSVANEIRLTVAPACQGSDGVDVRLGSAGKEIAHFEVAPGSAVTLPTTDPSATYDLVVSKRGNPWCDLVSLTAVQSKAPS